VQDAFYVLVNAVDGIKEPIKYLFAPLSVLAARKRVLFIIAFEIALLIGIDAVQDRRGIDGFLDAMPKRRALLVELVFACLIAVLAVKNTAAAFIYFQF